MKKLSLTYRLIFVILITFIISTFVATTISLFQIKTSLKEYFDTQLFYFAKTISSLDEDGFRNLKTAKLKNKSISLEDDALTFAIFDLNGDMIFSDGEDSKNFVFNSDFLKKQDDIYVDITKKHKIIWLLNDSKTFIVAVGQELEYIDDTLFDILEEQVIPWLIILPILIIVIIYLIIKELNPLKKLAKTLEIRDANDSSNIDANIYPKELKPFIYALNSLFLKISNMIENERRFTSNAAHELKTPLAALKVQAEVATLSLDDPDVLLSSLKNINLGVDRATRLVEQMLALFRIDNIKSLESIENIDWEKVIQSTIKEFGFDKNNKDIKIEFLKNGTQKKINGNSLLLSLLIKNILENGVKYNKKGATITISLDSDKLIIKDDGVGVKEEFLKHISDRFYRPSGQKESGSGLGLSIVKQIAYLHKFEVEFKSSEENGFEVVIRF